MRIQFSFMTSSHFGKPNNLSTSRQELIEYRLLSVHFSSFETWWSVLFSYSLTQSLTHSRSPFRSLICPSIHTLSHTLTGVQRWCCVCSHQRMWNGMNVPICTRDAQALHCCLSLLFLTLVHCVIIAVTAVVHPIVVFRIALFFLSIFIHARTLSSQFSFHHSSNEFYSLGCLFLLMCSHL